MEFDVIERGLWKMGDGLGILQRRRQIFRKAAPSIEQASDLPHNPNHHSFDLCA